MFARVAFPSSLVVEVSTPAVDAVPASVHTPILPTVHGVLERHFAYPREELAVVGAAEP